jgi:transcriptional regulator of heat shock response
MTQYLKEIERLKAELLEANHWRKRHSDDAVAYGKQSQKNWEEVQRLMKITAIQQKQIERLMDARDLEKMKVDRLTDLLHTRDAEKLEAERRAADLMKARDAEMAKCGEIAKDLEKADTLLKALEKQAADFWAKDKP